MSYHLSDLMQLAVAEDAAGLHLHVGDPPILELREQLMSIEGPCLKPADTILLLRAVAPPKELEKLEQDRRALFFYRFSEAIVFQVLAFRTNKIVRLELRIVNKYNEAA